MELLVRRRADASEHQRKGLELHVQNRCKESGSKLAALFVFVVCISFLESGCCRFHSAETQEEDRAAREWLHSWIIVDPGATFGEFTSALIVEKLPDLQLPT
jgi:hypothetical protein